MASGQLERLKTGIQEQVDGDIQEIMDLSFRIYRNPEVSWEEVHASSWLADYLEKNAFKVDRSICSLRTAFRASYGQGGPVIAFIAEYDALPDIGHACGHNIIGPVAAEAGVAAKLAADESSATVMVIGCPAEERLGGKVIMVDRGGFQGVDVAMMVHPSSSINWSGSQFMAATTLDVEFIGRSAHGARAWQGVSALAALILAFNNINAMRLHMPDKSRVHGVITDGGKVANVVPEHAAGKIMIRAHEDAQLDRLCEIVLNCCEGAALATGARLEHKWGLRVETMRSNSALLELWSKNMEALGRKVEERDEIKYPSASSDIANVSVVVPAIHPFIAISSKEIASHTPEFAAASDPHLAKQALVDGAKALAMTAADVMAQPEALLRIKKEFMQK